MPKKVTVIVNSEGKAVVSTQGFSGEACKNATRDMKRKLGESQTEVNTDEFYDHGLAPRQTVQE